MMQFGLVALSPPGEITVLARAAFGIVVLFVAIVPVVRGIWTSLRTRPDSDDRPDLDALWERYRRGEISWDEYLREEVEGVRGLLQTKKNPPGSSMSNDITS